jgi:CheY-like chemotaxis protein
MDDFLTKPFNADTLYGIIEDHLNGTQAKRILVIEDNPAYQTIVQSLLEANQYQVMIANDGLEGLNMARQNKPDLIVLDLLLPQMSGHEITHMLKRDRNCQKIPIVMFTCRDLDTEEELAKKSGVDAFVLKSSRPESLLVEINRLIGQQ